MKRNKTKKVKLKLPEPRCKNCTRNTLRECEESKGPNDTCDYHYHILVKQADDLLKLLEA